jgi:hypothetical protein
MQARKRRMAAWLIVAATLWATFAIAGVNEDLIGAASRGDLPEVKRLISNGADVNVKNDKGVTMLMVASWRGQQKVVQVLLEKGADVNAKANNGVSALIIASEKGHREIVQTLLDKGADVNAKTNDGATALIIVSDKGHREIAQTLLDKGADVNAKANNGLTALMVASEKGDRKIVQALLDKGADVNAKANNGLTALLAASLQGHRAIVQTLLEKGADVNAKANKDAAALMIAPDLEAAGAQHAEESGDWTSLLARPGKVSKKGGVACVDASRADLVVDYARTQGSSKGDTDELLFLLRDGSCKKLPPSTTVTVLQRRIRGHGPQMLKISIPGEANLWYIAGDFLVETFY